MENLLKHILSTPTSTIFVVAGLFFLLLAVAGSVIGKIHVPPERQKWAGIIGGVLILLGLFVTPLPKGEDVTISQVEPETIQNEISDIRDRLAELLKMQEQQQSAPPDAKPKSDEAAKAQADLEKEITALKSAQEQAQQQLKERLAISDLKHKIIEYYNTRGEWKGVFAIERIDKLKIEGNVAHVKYKYVPVQGNRLGRRDIGWDQRTFKLRKSGDTYEVIGMGGHNSARL